eukprot:TRINITY_DN16391_c0_g1_i1.p1 TRINITY_DN16391_c0_g1~~TRINITY_DN16391_c0_g1_i1.p1  ORF type:complete len:108 (+),score=12.29 TRINITY_DN16391_c0_g1_i1:232-555(+)
MEEEILSNHRQILQRIRDYSTEMPREVVGLINLPCGGPIKCHWSHCGTLEEGKREFEENMKIPFTPTVNTLGVSFIRNFVSFKFSTFFFPPAGIVPIGSPTFSCRSE